MKKKIIIIISLVIVLFAIIGVVYASVHLKQKQINEDKHLVEIKFSELEEKINNKESFILLISQTNCAHCAEYKPVFKRVLADYNITAYEIDEKKISKEENNKLKTIANVSGTPNTIFIVDGEEHSTSSRIVGSQPRDRIISRLKAMGYINEDK